MKIGYARVSTDDQTLDLQLDALQAAGCERIYNDVITGRATSRPEFDRMQEVLRPGDQVVVWKLDRLGRSLPHLVETVAQWGEQGVQFASLTEKIDTSSAMGEFFFHIMCSLAHMERRLISERTRAGLKAAKVRGQQGGRKRLLTYAQVEQARKMQASGMPVQEICDVFKISRSAFYKNKCHVEPSNP